MGYNPSEVMKPLLWSSSNPSKPMLECFGSNAVIVLPYQNWVDWVPGGEEDQQWVPSFVLYLSIWVIVYKKLKSFSCR